MEIKNFEELEKEIGNKRVLVLGGYSGLGYEKPTKLKIEIKKRLIQEIEQVGKDNVVLVSGATSDGIGVCYDVAKKLGVKTYGIVSEEARQYGVDKNCDVTFFVPDHKKTWQVLSESGDSYMVDVAKNNGVLIYYGGGEVAVKEIEEAMRKNIQVEVDSGFMPNPEKVKEKQEKNPRFYPTPVMKFVIQQKLWEPEYIKKFKIS